MDNTRANRPSGQIPLERIAETADLNWRWKRTLCAIASHMDLGNAFLSEGIRGAWAFRRSVSRDHCEALLSLGYLCFRTHDKTGFRRYTVDLERFADLERTARMLGRL